MLSSDGEDVLRLHIQQNIHDYVGKQLPFLKRKFCEIFGKKKKTVYNHRNHDFHAIVTYCILDMIL